MLLLNGKSFYRSQKDLKLKKTQLLSVIYLVTKAYKEDPHWCSMTDNDNFDATRVGKGNPFSI